MNIKDILNTFPKYLKTSDSPRLDVEVLLSHILKKDRSFILSHPEYSLSIFQLFYFFFLFLRRKSNTPIAYLTGHKEFFGRDFIVNKHTLIPRPETELLIEEVLKHAKSMVNGQWSMVNSKWLLVDVGTGSGIIPITLIKEFSENRELKTDNVIAIDISPPALKVAKKNAAKHGVSKNITFLQGDLISPLINQKLLTDNSKLIVVANLPYLTAEEMREPSIQKEPKTALYGGTDGLVLFRRLLLQLSTCNVKRITLFLETGSSHAHEVAALLKNHYPNNETRVLTDLAELDRLVVSIPKNLVLQ